MFKKAVTLLLFCSSIGLSQAVEEVKKVTDVAPTEAPKSDPLSKFQQKQVDHLLKQIDFDKIENSVRDKLSQEILEKQFREQLEKEMNHKVTDIVTQYKDLEKKWNSLDKTSEGNWQKYQGLTLKQMMKSIMDNLNTDKGRKELWKNSTPEDQENLKNLNLSLNLQTGDVKIKSDKKEPDGKESLFEWVLNTNSGKIEEITRKGNKERIVERVVNPDTLTVSDDFFKVVLPKDTAPVAIKTPSTKVVTPPSSEGTKTTEPAADVKKTDDPAVNPEEIPMTTADQREWDNMEMQRDVAFKIMYFFIVFIIATFGLLYTYFKMSQKAEEDARKEQMGMSHPNLKKQDVPKETFFDFLAGNMDQETYIGNQGTRMARANCGPNERQQTFNSTHRNDIGFGANNLENLIGSNDNEGHDLERHATFYNQ